MSKISDARIDLDRINKALDRMGCERKVTIWTQRDGGRGSRRVMFDNNHSISRRCTDSELALALEVVSAILQEVSRD